MIPSNLTPAIPQGHVLDVLRTLPEESVHCVVTSPPYWGLPTYSTEPQVWGSHPECNHSWETVTIPSGNGQVTHPMASETLNGSSATRSLRTSTSCIHCGAWKGELGLELTPARHEGYDALERTNGVTRKLQIKGSCLQPRSKPGQRLGRIDVRKDWDAILMVLLDANIEAVAMYEADRVEVLEALSAPGSSSTVS